MLDILNTNIIEYILNLYLSYEEDIIKLRKLYDSLQYEFSIKIHMIYKNINLEQKIFIDHKYRKYIKFYSDRKTKCVERYFTNIGMNGLETLYYPNGQKQIQTYCENGKYLGIYTVFSNNGNCIFFDEKIHKIVQNKKMYN
jgi:antitoxin component YwqK of YwqJK toxin-antitoxin module